jgi:outer membrane receptor protein involved in Fe transport
MADTKRAVLWLLALMVAAPGRVDADARTVRGVVRDPQGAAIPGATVDVGCGQERRRVTTSAAGEFVVDGLPDGRCSITALSEFFEPETLLVDPQGSAAATLILGVRKFASEIVVTPTRGVRESTFSVPEAVSVTSRRDIDGRPYTLLLQVLREEPGVMLQQTTSAQTSPIIRGFTGPANVYLIDGVRLNTGAWRPGPSQYTSWVNAGAIDSVEVVRGGGSVQYGSDALGGTVQFLSAPPLTSFVRPQFNGNIEIGGASADQSLSGQADLSFQMRSTSLRLGGSRRRVNDLRAGGGIDSHAAVTRFLGLPSTVLGSRQRATSFTQGGAFVIADAAPHAGATVHALFMHESQTGASRYDRLLGGEGLFRSGFDPQTLDFGVARYANPDIGIVNGGISATFSLNRQADGRFEQARPVARLDRQSGTTTALGYQLQAHHTFTATQQLTIGGEFYDEHTAASRELVEPTGVITSARPDIPDGTGYTNFGVFAQQTADLIPNRLSVRGGVRYSSFGFSTTPDALLGVVEEHVTSRSMTFQGTAVVRLTDATNVTANVTRGFRAANAADLGNIGLTGGGGFEITPTSAAALGAVIGSTGAADAVSTGRSATALRPEIVYQYEAGLKTRLGRFSGAVGVFDMEMFDFIQRRALVFDSNVVGVSISGFDIVRQDASGLAYIAQDVRPVATRVNVDRGRIVGFDAEGEFRLSTRWSSSAYFSLANGRALPTGEFLRRMPPPMGGGKVRWMTERLWLEGVVSFAAEQERLNSGDLSDARIGALRTRGSIATFFNGGATDLGLVDRGVLTATGESLAQVQQRVLGTATSAPLYSTHPGFVTLGARGGLRLPFGLDLTVLLENVTDVNYRLYGSGVDAPGFNAQVRTRYRF